MANSQEPKPTDLNALLVQKAYELTVKPSEDPADAAHRRRKDLALFMFALLGAGAIGAYCLWVLIEPSTSADDKKWAQSVLTAIITGLIGYLTGKSAR